MMAVKELSLPHWTALSVLLNLCLAASNSSWAKNFTSISYDSCLEIVSPGYIGIDTITGLNQVGPAYDTGVSFLRKMLPHVNISHSYLYDPTIKGCFEYIASAQNLLAKWYYNRNAGDDCALVIIASGCGESFLLEQFAAPWNVLLLTSVNSDVTLRDPVKSPTWVTTTPYPVTYYGAMYVELMRHYGWSDVFTVTDKDANLMTITRYVSENAISGMKAARGIHVTEMTFNSKLRNLDADSLLKTFSRISRVLLHFGPLTSLHELMVYVDMQIYDQFDIPGYLTWNVTSHSQNAMESYGSVLQIMMIDVDDQQGEEYRRLKANWWDAWSSVWKNNEMNNTQRPTDSISIASFGVFQMLGQVINELNVSSMGREELNDGRSWKRHFVNRTFNLVVGNISVDGFGDRVPTSVMRFFDVDRGRFTNYMKATVQDGAFAWRSFRPFEWRGGTQLPPNEPYCGFTGKSVKCLSEAGADYRPFWGFAAAAFFVLALGFAFVRARKLSAFSGDWWIVDPLGLDFARMRRTVMNLRLEDF
ncbi:hypothetical protein BV898_09237 [Hypsibius exemplaris]|uniref:Receptor ligand binding region domain-containing protein n=1 Tax=Hypsibius exemplaris TaxID=2072580 RepID=A0A1W0WN05_HYPEX|nr:hypothetical protein BV898_09237 [Hypsibius exemplaris]